jgi:hypothetical protein
MTSARGNGTARGLCKAGKGIPFLPFLVISSAAIRLSSLDKRPLDWGLKSNRLQADNRKQPIQFQ